MQKANKTNEQIARKYGMLGEMPVYRSEKKPDGGKSIYSSYFSSSGDGKINFLIKSSTGEIVIINRDHALFRIIQDASKKVPTVEILYQKVWLDEDLNELASNKIKNGDMWRIEGPGWYFNFYGVEAIIVRISPEDLKREMAFPF
ncbi:hypothetical protein HY249_00745 [Candidatus Azambacteria bacterium]|nr:hypothetical protein [Candidatus Azambacteria bacterium]